LQVHFIEH